MNRLTRRDLDGDPFLTPCDYKEVLERLAAYEDAGLDPEEIQRLVATNHTHAKNRREMFEELAKYKQAEAEGRLIALPCKEGTAVYRLTYNQHDGYSLEPRFFQITDINSVGKTVFLTLEEAEKALEEAQE